MKIIGFIYSEQEHPLSSQPDSKGWNMVLKGDSCLLNGRKPLFVPDWTQELGVTECVILRVSRLGKEISLKFADRYYDAYASGADFIAMDKAREAQQEGRPWTESIAFDYSLAIGEFIVDSLKLKEVGELKDESSSELILSPEEAIVEASRVMTIRQGDLIYIQYKQAPRPVQKEEIIRVEIYGEEKLYCKIK